MTIRLENELLWRTGHFRNPDPEFADCWNVTKDEALNLLEYDRRRMLAVRSYQLFSEQQLSELTQVVHGRPCNPDGEAKDATKTLWAQARCMHPDWPVGDDPDIAPLWNSEEANWPDSCRREQTFGRNFDALPGLSKDETDGIYWAIANNWTAAISDLTITPIFDRQQPPGVHGWHHLEAMSGGTLAWSQLALNRCDVTLKGAWNRNVNWSSKAKSAATGTHEEGHRVGLNHQPDQTATMYYAITQHSMGRYGYPNATDIAAMRSIGYKPHSDWESRRPPLEKLFLPRNGDDGPPPPISLEQQVQALQSDMFLVQLRLDAYEAMLKHVLGKFP